MTGSPDPSPRERLIQRVRNDFKYHPPTSPLVGTNHEQVRDILLDAALGLIDRTPIGREQSLMLTALEEAMHWANSAIAKEQYVPRGDIVRGE